MVSWSVCSSLVVFCSTLVVFCSAVVVFCSGLVVLCSAVEVFCSVYSALVGSCSVCSAVDVFCSVCSALVGSCSVCSAVEVFCPVCSTVVVFCPALVVFCYVVGILGPVCTAMVVLYSTRSAGSIMVPCFAGPASVPRSYTFTWTWPAVPPPVPPPLHHPPGLCDVWSIWNPLLGGGELCHESDLWTSVHSPPEVTRSPHWLLHYTNCCTSPPDYNSHHPLHWRHTQLISLITRSHLKTITQSHTLHKPWTSFHRSPSIVLRLALPKC